jgi:hypothetical protein
MKFLLRSACRLAAVAVWVVAAPAVAHEFTDQEICAQLKGLAGMNAQAVRGHAGAKDPADLLGHAQLSDLAIGDWPCTIDAEPPTEVACSLKGEPGLLQQLTSFTQACAAADIKKSDTPDPQRAYFWFTSGAMLRLSARSSGVVLTFVY